LIATAFFAADWIADGDANNLVGGRLFVGLHPLHMLVIAETGGGKSVIVQTIALQGAIALKFLVVIDDGLSFAEMAQEAPLLGAVGRLPACTRICQSTGTIRLRVASDRRFHRG
jgi:hypothetical protein